MKFSWMVDLLLLSSFLVKGQVNWCQRDCPWLRQKQLRCIFELRHRNELCSKIQSVITPADRRDILEYHNNLRDDVASGAQSWRVGDESPGGWDFFPSAAKNMRQLVWDYDLEENAQIYASQCDVRSHEPYDCAGTEEFPVVHMSKYDYSADLLSMDKVIKEWFRNKEVIQLYYLSWRIVSNYVPGPWDDFFAMIFSETFKLGCAKVLCKCDQKKPFYTTGSVICLYGPSPNFTSDGYQIYEVGDTACGSCPVDTACRSYSSWPHLCSRINDSIRPENIPSRLPSYAAASYQSTLLLVLFTVMVFLLLTIP